MRTRIRKPNHAIRIALLLTAIVGCSQTHHRTSADREAYSTIAERNNDPRWLENDLGIDMDARSRYFDPYDPDQSPMPIDDPAANQYMQVVDGRKGWKHWMRNGTRTELENPQWRVQLADYAELTQKNEVKLDVDSAVRLAYVHSPLNQNALETLYLTSLDVTGERFRLDTQFFGGPDTSYRHAGNLAPAAIGFNPALNRYTVSGPFNVAESNRLTVGNDLAASRRFATAGEVLIGFANSFAFEFTGQDVSLASSLANFSFIQPLLRGAGRDVALEQLTLSERRLLSNLRAYSQFRQGFFTQIVIGELGVAGPQRFGATTNLQSFSGFGGVNGYLGLLQQAQQIRNTKDNLRLQLLTLERLEAYYAAEIIDIVQVDQFRQNIEVTRANLLDQTNGLELAIDNYTTQILGLPADLAIKLDEGLIQQFQLIPPETAELSSDLLQLQQRIGNIGELLSLTARIELNAQQLPQLAQQNFVDIDFALNQIKGIVDAARRQLASMPNEFDDIPGIEQRILQLRESLPDTDDSTMTLTDVLEQRDELEARLSAASRRLAPILKNLTDTNSVDQVTSNADWIAEILALSRSVILVQSGVVNLGSEPEIVLADSDRLSADARALFEIARNDVDRMEAAAEQREETMTNIEKARFRQDREKLKQRLADLGAGLEETISELEKLRAEYSVEKRVATVRRLTGWVQSYRQLVERLALLPAQARLDVITVGTVDLDAETAFKIALDNRLDFMNGRAALVDRWRAIQVAADALQSNLSITGDGNVGTAKNNPVDFRASTGSMRLGVEFDAPLARLLERNGYREALIEYQRNRRGLIQSRDRLQLGLRALLRTLKQRRLQLEIQRRAVSIALRRVDQTQLSLLTPPPQPQPGVRPQINPTTAINLLGAQGSLQSSQNSFLAAWLNYYAAKLRLYRELGIMQLDPSGKWIESSIDFDAEFSPEADGTLPPAVPIPMEDEPRADDARARDPVAENTDAANAEAGNKDTRNTFERNENKAAIDTEFGHAEPQPISIGGKSEPQPISIAR